MRRSDRDKGLSEEEKELDRYLSQFADYYHHRKCLRGRRRQMVKDFLRAGSEADKEIIEQINTAENYLTKVLKVIDFLPDGRKKYIIESKYLDGHSWDKISMEYSISTSQAVRDWKSGLRDLMERVEVREIVLEKK